MFKFIAKGDNHDNEAAMFYNGQRLFAVYSTVDADGEVRVQIEDGSGRLMKEWEDFLEDYERLN